MDPTYKAIFHASSLGSVILERQNPEAFIIVDINQAAYRTAAWRSDTCQDVLGKNIADVFEGVREY